MLLVTSDVLLENSHRQVMHFTCRVVANVSSELTGAHAAFRSAYRCPAGLVVRDGTVCSIFGRGRFPCL